MSKIVSLLCVCALAGLTACGGSGSSGSGGGASSGGEHEDHHPHIAEVTALHDEIAPVFHAEPGVVRASAACEHASALHERSLAVQSATLPASIDAEAWRSATIDLVVAADALQTECSGQGPAVEERLSHLHDSFHRVMEIAAGDEHHDGDHHDGEHHDGDHHDGDHHDGDHHDGDHHDGDHHDGDHHDGDHHDGDHHDAPDAGAPTH